MRDPLHIRLLAMLLWLYPPSFRSRYGGGIIAVARASCDPRPWRVIADALVTLGRAWLHVIGGAVAVRLHAGHALGALTRDAAVTVRGVRRRPLDGLVIVLTLAVALGANVAIYTVSHTLLLATLPYADPERIMDVDAAPLAMVRIGEDISWKVGKALVDHPGVEAAATYYPEAGANLVEGSDASRVRITQVSPSFFRVLGVRMLLGPGLIEDDAATERAVLGYDLWRGALGADPGLIGRTIQLSGRSYVIAGVAPREVDFPNATELWLTDPPVAEFFGGAIGPSVIARLRPGAQAVVSAALAEYADAERAEVGPEHAHWIRAASFTPLRDRLVASIERPLLVLSAAAAVVLLLGCVNVAGVTLARLAGRRQELAMRRALGASRVRIFGQLMVELGVLAVLAGMLSMVLAVVLVPLLASLLPAGTPRLQAAMRPGAAMWLFAGGATLLAMFLAGLPPAIAAARGCGGNAHPDRLRGDDAVRQRGHGVLTTIQVALAVMLVVAAALFGRTLAELRAVPLGYDTERALTFEVSLPEASYPTAAAAQGYLSEVLARIGALPGVEAAGAIDRPPLSGSMGMSLNVQRPDAPAQARVSAGYRRATPQLFTALGIRIHAGRTFSQRPGAVTEVIISRDLARRLFGSTHPVGQQIQVSPGRGGWDATVIGVVDDVRFDGAEGDIRPAFYHNLAPSPRGRFSIVVRASDPVGLAADLRAVLLAVDPRVPPFQLRTTGDAALQVIAARRAVAIIATLFGATALCLALLALYGLLAQSVALRRHELGVRLALGAPVHSIEGLVVGRGMAYTAAGVAVGLLLSSNVTQLIEGMLFGVAPADFRIMAATALVVLLAALAASWLPARRAGRTDPMTTLRAN